MPLTGTPEEIRAKRRAEYRTNATAYIRRSKEYRKTPEGRRVERNSRLKSQYGITLVEWEQMFRTQKGLCAICKVHPIKHTDHSHKTKAVRGLLCHGCNLGLGGFKDSVEALREAILYLERNDSRRDCDELR